MTETPNNETKASGPLRIGLVLEHEYPESLPAAIEACVLLQPLGQAGLPAPDGLRAVPRFDDPRLLLAQAGIEAIVLAASTRNAADLASMAADRGLHVWRLPPLARSFAEAAELAGRARQRPTIYRVASWWEYVTDHVWHELRWPGDVTPLFSELHISARGPASDAWQARQADAGGGVLALSAYAALEALVALRGLPETVAATIGRARRTHNSVTRETEELALAVLRYTGGGTAIVRATWDLPPFGWQVVHYGADTTITLTPDEVLLSDAAGALLDRRPLPGEFLGSELPKFAELVRGRARDRAAAPLPRHLAVSALIDALYLSARTGQPESPGKVYSVQGGPGPRS